MHRPSSVRSHFEEPNTLKISLKEGTSRARDLSHLWFSKCGPDHRNREQEEELTGKRKPLSMSVTRKINSLMREGKTNEAERLRLYYTRIKKRRL